MKTNWPKVATHLADAQPDHFYRQRTVEILQYIEEMGPLGPPIEEFARVYTFLHYNEPAAVLCVAKRLHGRATDGPARYRLRITNNAWRYTVAAYDQWYGDARIVYLAAGLIEGTLRSRLNAHLTQRFGAAWPDVDEAVPPFVRHSEMLQIRAKRMRKIEKRIEELPISPSPAEQAAFLESVQELVTEPPESARGDGPAFLADLTLGAIQSFFTDETTYGRKAQVKEVLRDHLTGQPIPPAQIEAAFKRYRDDRNNVAHYRLGATISFPQTLFTSAKIARWLNVDLQHFYGSVDVRQSTELSRLLGQDSRDKVISTRKSPLSCEEGCTNPGPFDWLMLDRTPLNNGDIAGLTIRWACLQHRESYRATLHRHPAP